MNYFGKSDARIASGAVCKHGNAGGWANCPKCLQERAAIVAAEEKKKKKDWEEKTSPIPTEILVEMEVDQGLYQYVPVAEFLRQHPGATWVDGKLYKYAGSMFPVPTK